jgi:DNA polymerase-1
MMKKVKKTGYVITPFGRILRVPLDNLHSAADYDIQGTAAEILKRGEVAVYDFLIHTLKSEVNMILPVHDELLFDAPDYPLWEKRQIVQEISKRMTTMPEIRVPLDTEWKESDTSWADAKEMTLN